MAKERLLSRAAERIYWLGRYVERTENTARLLNVYGNLLFDLPLKTRFGWYTLIELLGAGEDFESRYSRRDERNIVKFLIVDRFHPVSLGATSAAARENARTSRELIPAAAWEVLNDLHYHIRDRGQTALARKARGELLADVVAFCQRLNGLIDGTMSQDSAFHFLKLGQTLERADMITRIIDIAAATELSANGDDAARLLEESGGYENSLWLSVLTSTSATQMYRRHFSERVEPGDVINFMLADVAFPRACMSCLMAAGRALDRLPDGKAVMTEINAAKRHLAKSPDLTFENGVLHDFIDQLQCRLAAAHAHVSETWFHHPA